MSLFDYLYVKDLATITSWFIENDAREQGLQRLHRTARGAHGISQNVAAGLGGSGAIRMFRSLTDGMGPEYSADNSRMLTEMGRYQFWDFAGRDQGPLCLV